jgi:predicted SnoaL-like aldol condensation-catalyzing enzyme
VGFEPTPVYNKNKKVTVLPIETLADTRDVAEALTPTGHSQSTYNQYRPNTPDGQWKANPVYIFLTNSSRENPTSHNLCVATVR